MYNFLSLPRPVVGLTIITFLTACADGNSYDTALRSSENRVSLTRITIASPQIQFTDAVNPALNLTNDPKLAGTTNWLALYIGTIFSDDGIQVIQQSGSSCSGHLLRHSYKSNVDSELYQKPWIDGRVTPFSIYLGPGPQDISTTTMRATVINCATKQTVWSKEALVRDLPLETSKNFKAYLREFYQSID